MSLIGTMGSGVSALRTFMKGLEVIGSNIANVNTTGYKAQDAKYADSFSNILQRSSPSSATAGNTPSTGIGTGVVLAGINTNFSQGSLASTGKETDLGISGNGFFRVKNTVDNSEFASRSGDFRWDDQGFLVTPQGFRVQGTTGAGTVGDIQLGTPPAGFQRQSVTIDRAGSVVEFYSDGSSVATNQILLQNYTDPAALVKEGNNLYTGLLAAGPIGATAGTITLDTTVNVAGSNGLGLIQSGTLELSNVDLTDQFASLITTQRSFQAASRLVTVSDSVLEDIVNLKR
jgi:flagellar hook protein FlgE